MSERSKNEELVFRLAKRLDPRDPEAAAEALHSSGTFHGDLKWLERLFAVADSHSMPPVPEALTSSLLGIVEAEAITAAFDADFELAVLIHDSRSETELLGVRGPGTVAAAWSAIYSTPTADLIVDGTPEGSTTAVRGHLLNRVGDQMAVQVSNDATGRTVSSDAKGVFDFGSLGPGEYDMRVVGRGVNFGWKLALP